MFSRHVSERRRDRFAVADGAGDLSKLGDKVHCFKRVLCYNLLGSLRRYQQLGCLIADGSVKYTVDDGFIRSFHSLFQ